MPEKNYKDFYWSLDFQRTERLLTGPDFQRNQKDFYKIPDSRKYKDFYYRLGFMIFKSQEFYWKVDFLKLYGTSIGACIYQKLEGLVLETWKNMARSFIRDWSPSKKKLEGFLSKSGFKKGRF